MTDDDERRSVTRTAVNAIAGGAMARGLGFPPWLGSVAAVGAQVVKDDPRLPAVLRAAARLFSLPGAVAAGDDARIGRVLPALNTINQEGNVVPPREDSK